MNEHILKICKYVGSAIVGIFGFLLAVVGIVKEAHKLDVDDDAVESLKADTEDNPLLEEDD